MGQVERKEFSKREIIGNSSFEEKVLDADVGGRWKVFHFAIMSWRGIFCHVKNGEELLCVWKEVATLQRVSVARSL